MNSIRHKTEPSRPEDKRLTYYQQLRDPRWIGFATALKSANNWKCEHCERRQGDVELTIHHTLYVRDKSLWEYPRFLLMCLCTECHFKRQEIEERIYLNIADVLREKTNEELLRQPIHAFFNDGFTFTER